MSQLRPTFLSLSSLREVTGVPVLGVISMTWTDEQKIRKTRRLWALGASVFMLVGVYSGIIAISMLKGIA
jgi:hypothetical protein